MKTIFLEHVEREFRKLARAKSPSFGGVRGGLAFSLLLLAVSLLRGLPFIHNFLLIKHRYACVLLSL